MIITKKKIQEISFALLKLELLRKRMKEIQDELKELDKVYMEYWRETTQFYDGFDKNGDQIKYHIFHHPFGSPSFTVRDGCNFFNKSLFECNSHKDALEWIFEQIGVEKDE